MAEFSFKPAGSAMAAIVASLAPAGAHAEAPKPVKKDHGAELAAAAARFPAAVPLGDASAASQQKSLFDSNSTP